MLAVSDAKLQARLQDYRRQMAEKVEESSQKLKEKL